MNTQRAVLLSSMIGLAMAVLLAVTIVGWLVWPYKPAAFPQQPFEVSKESYEQGETFSYKLDMTKYRDLKGTITYQFVDGVIYTVPGEYESNLPIGHHEIWSNSLSIPENLPPGKYHMRATLVYEVNPLRTIQFILETEPFMVTARN